MKMRTWKKGVILLVVLFAIYLMVVPILWSGDCPGPCNPIPTVATRTPSAYDLEATALKNRPTEPFYIPHATATP